VLSYELQRIHVSNSLKPIFLLADSQLLFLRDEEGRRFLDRARELIAAEAPEKQPKAAYLGASNGDAPEFYELFAGAMAEIGIRNCRQIPSQPTDEDRSFLEQADLILLSGGDVRRGWDVFVKTGLKDRLAARYYDGAVMVGVSAGAVQLGLKGWEEDGSSLFDTLSLVPFVVDVHDDPSWSRLLAAVAKAGEHTRGFGIPTGGGALYHPDYSVEPVRSPLTEVELTPSGPRQALLFPGQGAAEEPAEPQVLSQEEVLERALRDLGSSEPDPSVN
jgi:cyanophycinase-like exopeptidase